MASISVNAASHKFRDGECQECLSMKTLGEILLQISSFHLSSYHGSHACLLAYLTSSEPVLLRQIHYDSVTISGKVCCEKRFVPFPVSWHFVSQECFILPCKILWLPTGDTPVVSFRTRLVMLPGRFVKNRQSFYGVC